MNTVPQHFLTHFKRYILLFSITLLLVWTVKPSNVNSAKLGYNKQDNLVFIADEDLLLNAETSKVQICYTATRLYERGIKDRKPVSWDAIFISLDILFSRNSTLINKRVLLTEAKLFCPTYQDAVRIIEQENPTTKNKPDIGNSST
jgi:hypothetical protein